MSQCLERGWQGWGDGDVRINKDEKNKKELPFQLAFTEPVVWSLGLTINLFFLVCITPGGNN